MRVALCGCTCLCACSRLALCTGSRVCVAPVSRLATRSGCVHACSSLLYVDVEDDCSGWAANGECEGNPGFMFERCNHSCVTLARRNIGRGDQQARPNPHLASELLGGDEDGAAGTSHRASTFIPIFVLVLVVLIAIAAIGTAFAPLIAEQGEALEDQLIRVSSRIQRKYPALAPYLLGITTNRVATTFICLYYLNESLTVLQTNPLFAAFFPFSSDGVWQQHVAWVDASNLMGGAAAICCLLGFRPLACGVVMLGDTLVDSYLLLWRIGVNFLYGHGLYINELMAKKFSLLGCVALMIASLANANSQTAFSGMLLEVSAATARMVPACGSSGAHPPSPLPLHLPLHASHCDVALQLCACASPTGARPVGAHLARPPLRPPPHRRPLPLRRLHRATPPPLPAIHALPARRRPRCRLAKGGRALAGPPLYPRRQD